LVLKKLYKSSTVYLFGSILTKALGFLLLPFYTRYLSVSDYGTIELIELVINVSAIIFGLGIFGSAMTRIYHSFEGRVDKNNVVATSIFISFLASSLVATIGILFSTSISNLVFHEESFANIISVSLSIIVISNVVEICLVYIRLMDNPRLFIKISVAQFVLTASLNILFIGYFGLGIWGFVFSKLISFSVVIVPLLINVIRDVGCSIKYSIAVKIFKFGLPLIGVGISFFIIHFSDRFFIQYYHGLGAVGIYSVAYKLGFLITYAVGEPFGKVWNVSLYAFVKNLNWKRNFADIFSYLVLVMLLVWAVLAYYSIEIVTLMVSTEFREAAILVPLLALAYVFKEMGDFFRQLMYINNKTGIVSRVSFFCAIVNLLGNFILVDLYGTVGAMFATLVTWFIYAAILFYISQKEHGIPYRKAIVKTILFVIFLYVLTVFIRIESITLLFLFHSVVFITFIMSIVYGNYITGNEKRAVVKHYRKILSRLLS